jgi:hypothetical protein
VHGEIRPEHVLVFDEPGYPAFVQLGGFVRIPPPGPPEQPTAWEGVWRTPEQLFHHSVGPTTDGYAVAAIAFALLVGRTPFPAGSREALMRAKHDPRFDVSEGLAAAFPAEVIHFFQNALAWDPAERYGADGFHQALDAALDAMAGGAEGELEPSPEEPVAPEPPAREGRPPRYHTTEPIHTAEAEPAREGRPPRFHHEPREGGVPHLEPQTVARAGRPPRFHQASQEGFHAPERAPPEADLDLPAHPAGKPRHGSTQEMSVDELEDLAAGRPPRMHKSKGPGER